MLVLRRHHALRPQHFDTLIVPVCGASGIADDRFPELETIPKGAGGEVQLTDAIAALLKEEQVLAYQFKGERYDCGSKLGYLKATVEYALQHQELSEEFRKYLRDRFGENGSGIASLIKSA